VVVSTPLQAGGGGDGGSSIVRVCRSMGVCCASHQLLLSFASRVRWGWAYLFNTLSFASRVRLMGVCCTSHQLPSFASRVR